MSHVLLLQKCSDKYETAFISSGLVPHSISVLETVLVNESNLRDIVGAGAKSGCFDGVILTSSRACDAWSAAVLSIDADGTRTDSGTLNLARSVLVVVRAHSMETQAGMTSRFMLLVQLPLLL